MYRFSYSEMPVGGSFTAAELELAAIRESHAVLELAPDGTILDLNDRFLAIIGYTRDELVGRHHRMLLSPGDQDSRDYAIFWQALNTGEHIAAQFKRRRKDGQHVWIQGSYNPVRGPDGAIFKIVKFATDITAHTLKSADDAGQLEAIDRSQAVISFTLDGTILSANAQFCSALGYAEADIVGRHHSMFLTADERGSEAYRDFWRMLAKGQSNGGEFRRISKDGRKVWLQATYTPILDPDGQPFKIVKFATDITAEKIKSADDSGQIDAIGRAQAVITFSLDGYILSANSIFCDAIGYCEADLIGRHHRLLVRDSERDTPEYQAFWRSLARGEPMAGEFCRIRADSKEVWLQATYAPILDPEGQPLKVVKYARDVTEDVMQRSKFNLLSLVADNTDNAVIITDRRRHIFYANAGFERMTGHALQDVIGRNPVDLLGGQYTDPATTALIHKKIEAGESFYGEIMYYNRNGQPYWASLAINPVRNADGEIDRFISIQANITETKLRALEFDAKLLAIQSMTAMAEWTIGGDLLIVNDALSGRAPVTLSQLLNKQECESLVSGNVLQRELLWPTGPELWLSATFSVMKNIEGEACKILMCGTDSTPRKHIVAQSAQAMQDMLSAVTQAVGDIDKIATATKQLSINASIEAARAAEAGKGFAVVASEVRTLASEASRAAANISALIRDSRTHINGLIGTDVP